MKNITKTTQTILFAGLIAAMILPFSGMPMAEAAPNENANDKAKDTEVYKMNDVFHSFTVMEDYVIYDDKKNISFDILQALQDPQISNKDIIIGLEYANLNNELMDIQNDIKDNPKNDASTDHQKYDDKIGKKMKEIKDGKFKEMFTSNHIPVSGIMNTPEFPIYQMMFRDTSLSNTNSETYKVRHPSGGSTLACGGDYQNPHPADSNRERVSGFSSLNEAQSDLYSDRYHMVPEYATFLGESSRPYDFAKVVSSGAPGGCNNGPFRDQAIINTSGTYYQISEDEPNPEVLSYSWPKLWWATYVQWWHVNF